MLTWLNMQAAGPRPCQPAGGCAGCRAATPARAEVCGLRLQACQACQTHEVPGCLVMFRSGDQLSEHPADGATGSVGGGHFSVAAAVQDPGFMGCVTHGKLRVGAAMHPAMLLWPLLPSAVQDLGSVAESAAFSWDPCAGACGSAWLLHWHKVLIGPNADPFRAKHCRLGMILTLDCGSFSPCAACRPCQQRNSCPRGTSHPAASAPEVVEEAASAGPLDLEARASVLVCGLTLASGDCTLSCGSDLWTVRPCFWTLLPAHYWGDSRTGQVLLTAVGLGFRVWDVGQVLAHCALLKSHGASAI